MTRGQRVCIRIQVCRQVFCGDDRHKHFYPIFILLNFLRNLSNKWFFLIENMKENVPFTQWLEKIRLNWKKFPVNPKFLFSGPNDILGPNTETPPICPSILRYVPLYSNSLLWSLFPRQWTASIPRHINLSGLRRKEGSVGWDLRHSSQLVNYN